MELPISADILEIGKSGIFSSRKSLQTAGHNIANVNTEGYSRQRAVQHTNEPIGEGGLVFGSGSQIKAIERVNSDHVEKQMLEVLGQHGFDTTRSSQLNNLEAIFNEITTEGLNQLLTRFFNSFRELSNNPENDALRSMVRENGRIFVKDLKRASEGLKQLVRNVDKIFEEGVTDINNSLQDIARLNTRIREMEISSNGESGDLRDRRDLAIRNLAQYFSLETYVDDQGKLTVNAKGIGTLVSGNFVQNLRASPSMQNNSFPGSMEIYVDSRPNTPVTSFFSHGKLGAIYETRENEITLMKDKIDKMAWQASNSVNAIHRKGFINRPIPQQDLSGPESAEKIKAYTGVNFFAPLKEKNRAAEYLELSPEIMEDIHNISSAYVPNAPGDNRVSIAISQLQHEFVAGGGTKTLEEDYLEGVGMVGLASGKAKVNEEQSEGILAQINSIRERISGVSIDEESANMVRYQHAYEASARVIRVADEMFKTVLGLKN